MSDLTSKWALLEFQRNTPGGLHHVKLKHEHAIKT